MNLPPPKFKRGEACLLIAENGIVCDCYILDLNWVTEEPIIIFKAVGKRVSIPTNETFTGYLYHVGAIYRNEKEDGSLVSQVFEAAVPENRLRKIDDDDGKGKGPKRPQDPDLDPALKKILDRLVSCKVNNTV